KSGTRADGRTVRNQVTRPSVAPRVATVGVRGARLVLLLAVASTRALRIVPRHRPRVVGGDLPFAGDPVQSDDGAVRRVRDFDEGLGSLVAVEISDLGCAPAVGVSVKRLGILFFHI